jgi:hypothetical protein
MSSNNIQLMKDLIVQLGNDEGLAIPGLDIDPVLEEIAKQNEDLQAALAQISPEEAKKIIKRFKETLKDEVQEKIAIIKMNANAIQSGIENIRDTVSATIRNILVPPAVGPVTPNPIYAAAVALQTKKQLSASLTVLFSAFAIMLGAAVSIKFSLPQSILSLLSGLVAIKTLINTIPG